jgi:CubicO group peptidase (beta-lactamase class C family)
MSAEIPAANMHATAKALAELVHPFADEGRFRGRRIIGPQTIARAIEERIVGEDLVLPFRLSWSAGFMANTNRHFGPSPTAFGHAGFGGSSVMFDPAHRLSAAYAMNRMSAYLVGDPRGLRLMDALYAAL